MCVCVCVCEVAVVDYWVPTTYSTTPAKTERYIRTDKHTLFHRINVRVCSRLLSLRTLFCTSP